MVRQRQAKANARARPPLACPALGQRTLQPHLAAVHFYESFADAQPKAAPAVTAADRAVQLLERLKEPLLILRGDPRARIRYADVHSSGIRTSRQGELASSTVL